MDNKLIGKWCKPLSNPGYYIKVKKVIDRKSYNELVGETICIDRKTKYNSDDYWANTAMEDSLVIVPISEIQHLLPYKINEQFKIYI